MDLDNRNGRGWKPWAWQIFVAGFVAMMVTQGREAPWGSTVRAEPRRVTPQAPEQHFKSGGRLSETVLQDILVVLQRMDERLERLEKIAASAGGSMGTANSAGNTTSTYRAPAAAIEVRRGP